MRIVVAPDSYKGSLSAIEVADSIERGIRQVWPQAEVVKIPIADGGEGTVQALVAATGGRLVDATVMGPLGDAVASYWGLLGDGETAVIEMAAASGLPMVPPARRNPCVTTTYGTGQLIRAALDHGCRKMIIGIGGSATNDGGAGMAQALGARFYDAAGEELPPGGLALARLARIDLRGLDARLSQTEIMVACDVDNPLCGPRGASAVFGPQKGATPAMVADLDRALAHYAAAAAAATGRDVASCAGAGAAGGLGAGLLFFTDAKLRPGVEIVLEATDFAGHVRQADLVITGEGRTDVQTAYGKAPVGVAKVAGGYGVPVLCISGGLGDGAAAVYDHGIAGLMAIVPQPMPLDACLAQAADLLEDATARMLRLVAVGQGLAK